ncbi:DUF2207 domain-containing protein [Leucobacter sp. UCMA 4100]|uniref:DUF2207 domain-containing protein n=1 Tax=Leucobacter sp. UCMA 4100 TaxID=2810534 RepID=UPI0022EA472A|nr:DUF2207 domain-containing protein [Leucobacter sp. UCMA 4100]MDA3145915.1 DUF2207 domain-containing protein [Leucobacter sp. UCMA 4100]
MPTPFLSLVATLFLSVSSLFSPAVTESTVEDFLYESWDTNIDLETTEDGRAVAHVTETLVALFPDHDQNKGIVRGIPAKFHGANSMPENVTVTDENGTPTPFFTETEDRFFVILTGNDDYVQGRTTYVITYDIPDPVFVPDDAAVDEFLWDMVSVDRAQAISSFSASVTVDDTLSTAFNGDMTAYAGVAGSRNTVNLHHEGNRFSIDPLPLGRDVVVTLGLGFAKDTVVQPPKRQSNPVVTIMPFAVSLGSMGAAVAAQIAFVRFRRRHRETGRAIIAQYEAPAQLPPLIAAAIMHPASLDPIAPEYLHLAVKGNIRIEEQLKPNGNLYRDPRIVLRNMTPGTASHSVTDDALDAAMLDALFTSKHPESRAIPKSSTKFASRMGQLTADGKSESDKRGYFTREASPVAKILSLVGIALAIVSGVLLAYASATGFDRGITLVAMPLMTTSFALSIVGLFKRRVHTPLGAEAYEYLEGLKLFISVAETERIRMLQSYSGAERAELDGVTIVQLYERLLPYATLFGLEKEWSRVLASRYEAERISTPYWYPYLATRGITSMSSSLGAFSGAVTSAASYTASTSSGSSGGGFAGGGGGGGFSGGR